MTTPVQALVVNCGSTSVKVARYERGPDDRLRHVAGHDESIDRTEGARGVEDALASALTATLDHTGGDEARPCVVGHRVVHGGIRLAAPALIDHDVEEAITEARVLAPLHNDAALAGMRVVRAVLGDAIPMVAVFDTAFHAGMPERAATYAIERELTDRHGLRRFGFHGLAHRSMVLQAVDQCGVPVDALNAVTLQLGGGCSVAAILGGASVDVSMGLTPLEGLVMATRAGDVDPTLITRIARLEGQSPQEVEARLNSRAGLLGVSGLSGDIRDLLAAEHDDPNAALALEMFCYRARKYVGAYLAAIGGADVIVFGGGIGEHSPEIRRRICAGLEWHGIVLDHPANDAAIGGVARIDDASSRVRVLVADVDEAVLIARDAFAVVEHTG